MPGGTAQHLHRGGHIHVGIRHYRRTILMGEGHRAHRLCRLQRGSHRLPGVAFVPVQLYGVAIGQRRIAHPADIRQGGMLAWGTVVSCHKSSEEASGKSTCSCITPSDRVVTL